MALGALSKWYTGTRKTRKLEHAHIAYVLVLALLSVKETEFSFEDGEFLPPICRRDGFRVETRVAQDSLCVWRRRYRVKRHNEVHVSVMDENPQCDVCASSCHCVR